MDGGTNRGLSFVANIYLSVILSLLGVLGALCGAFFEASLFSGIALLALCLIIFLIARDKIPVCLIILPALLVVWAGGGFGAPAVFVGFIFATAATAYLWLGRRRIFVLTLFALAFVLAAIIRSPLVALSSLLPCLVGIAIALLFGRARLSLCVLVGSALVFISLLAALALSASAQGSSLLGLAQSARTQLAQFFTVGKVITFDKDSAVNLADAIIDISPSLIFASSSALVYLSYSLLLSFLRSSGMEELIGEDSRRLVLLPQTAILISLAFFGSMVFELVGDGGELALAVCYNIIFATLLPLLAVGFRMGINLLSRYVFKSATRAVAFSVALIALSVFFLPMLALPSALCLGLADSLIPLYRQIASKIKSKNNE